MISRRLEYSDYKILGNLLDYAFCKIQFVSNLSSAFSLSPARVQAFSAWQKVRISKALLTDTREVSRPVYHYQRLQHPNSWHYLVMSFLA